MTTYLHKVQYYETDKMGITHHSNYIRFMEEARMALLAELGFPMTRLEAEGFVSPVVSVNCEYRHTSTYGDELAITVLPSAYTGARLSLAYTMRNTATGTIVATASSSHCFLGQSGRPVSLKKALPAFDAALRALLEQDQKHPET